jgi:hypothetical protein
MFGSMVRGVAAALIFMAVPAIAADDPGLERLALCRDSWKDWQTANAPQLTTFAAHLRADFTQKQGDAFVTPKTPLSLLGLRVLQVYPESVGMGVGFSVLVDAPFDKTKAVFAAKLGKPLQRCETDEGMRGCQTQFAPERTFMLAQGDHNQTLAGCYYLYER